MKVVPSLAPEYGEAAIAIDDQVKKVSIGLKSAPYIANAANNTTQKVGNVLPFGSLGYVTTTSRYKAAEKALKENPKHKKSNRRQSRWRCRIGAQQNHPD